jgi:hypothetical protein
MKNTDSRNIVQQVMNEYVVWGGPIVTRHEAYKDCIAKGMTTREADYCAFARQSVEAPEDPAAHLAFLRRIQLAEGMLQAVAA